MNRGWSVEMLLKPRLFNEYIPTSGETTLNKIYPQNKNIFFYLGARAENKFYHHANGTPNCFTGYTRVTSDLYNCIQTCACCNRTVTDSRCIYVYPPRSLYGIHDPHVNYGCHECRGIPEQKITCGCNCNLDPCESCGWECQTHTCASIIEPTPIPTPTPTSTPRPPMSSSRSTAPSRRRPTPFACALCRVWSISSSSPTRCAPPIRPMTSTSTAISLTQPHPSSARSSGRSRRAVPRCRQRIWQAHPAPRRQPAPRAV